MSLKTYEHPNENHVVALHGSDTSYAVNLSPGAWVRDKYVENSVGVLIAVGDDFITVLWSRHRSGVIFTPEDFKPRKGIMTRYAKKLINQSFYGTITVSDLLASGST